MDGRATGRAGERVWTNRGLELGDAVDDALGHRVASVPAAQLGGVHGDGAVADNGLKSPLLLALVQDKVAVGAAKVACRA